LYTLGIHTKLFVNAGIGLTFLPIRFGVPPEIVYYEI
ncbi:MAG: metallophosphoesterase, partial [Lactococcus garvieae]